MNRRFPRAVLFDLDGTLIDSVPDLHGALVTLLNRHGLGPLAPEQVRGMVGNGVRKLVERGFEACGQRLDTVSLDRLYDEMMQIYGARLTRLTALMPGTREVVNACREIYLKLACVTNKPQAATEAILAHFDLAHAFPVVIGGDTGLPRKPAADMALAAAKQLGEEPADCVLVGDSAADVGCGKAAGMGTVVVAGGYTLTPVGELGADEVIDRLSDLPRLFQLASDRQVVNDPASPRINSK